MAAFALQEIVQTRYYIRLDSSVAATESDHTLLLDAVRFQTDAQTAVIYGFQQQTSELSGITARADNAPRVKDVGLTLSHPTSLWIERLAGAAEGRPAADSRFEKFPEVLQYQLNRLLIVPLRAHNDLLGLLPHLRYSSRSKKLSTDVGAGVCRLVYFRTRSR